MNIFSRFYEIFKDSIRYNLFHPKPNQLILFVTSKCNFKCETCFNWQNLNKEADDLTLDEIRKISLNFGKIKTLLLSGGEPFLRSDLIDIISIFYKNNKAKTLHLPTNGFLTKLIIEKTKFMLDTMPDLKIFMGISLDALSENHDLIKKTKSAFSRAIQTQRGMVELEKKYKNLKSTFLTVISNQNIDEIDSLFKFIRKEFGYNKISFSPLRGNPYNSSLREPSYFEWKSVFQTYKNFAVKAPFGTKQFFINRKIDYMNKIYLDVLKNHKLSQITCSAGNNICVIESNGNVKLCELKKPIANLINYEYDVTKILNKKQRHTCFCTHACFLNASLDISPIKYVRSYLNI